MSNDSNKPIINRLPPIWLLILCSAIGPIAMTTPVPAMTEIMRDFAIDYGSVQLTLTVFLVATGIAQLFLGALSDRFGRRPVMLTGLLVFAAGGVFCAMATQLEWLLLGRFIQGIGGAAGLTLSRAIVRDVYDRAKTASVIGYVTMGMVVAPMIGPTLGGLVTDYLDWHYIFLGMTIFAVLLAATSYFHLNETLTGSSHQRPTLLGSAPTLLRDRNFVAYTLNLAFCAAMFYTFIAGAPYYVMEVLGVSASEYGVYSVFTAMGYMLGNFLSGRFSEQTGPDKMLYLAFIPAGIGLALFWLGYGIQHPWAIFIPMFFITLSNGLTIPNGNAAALSIYPKMAGAASGISGAVTIATGAIMTMVIGFLQNDERWPFLLIISLCGLMAFVSLRRVR